MDSKDLRGLSYTVTKFKAVLLEALGTNYAAFHTALNGEEPLKFNGLRAGLDDPNEYLIDISDLLFWLDSTAYIDELERWEGAIISEKHNAVLQYLKDSDQISVFADLVEAVKRKRIAPFVGAGFSKPCNFPLWGEAIQQLVNKLEGVSRSEERSLHSPITYLNRVKKLLGEWRYLEAAQLIYTNDKTQLEAFIRNKFQLNPDAIITVPAKLLPDIADGCIVTTNFDSVIETVFEEANRPIRGYMHGIQSHNQFVPKLIQGERCILKLHGDVADPETYIFSEAQYNLAYGRNKIDFTKPLAKTLRQIFISHSLLFLGCSLAQDRTMDLFKWIVQKNEFNIPGHFAILPRPPIHEDSLAKEDQLLETKIRPIWYEVGEGHDHSQLEYLLSFLVDCSKGRARIKV